MDTILWIYLILLLTSLSLTYYSLSDYWIILGINSINCIFFGYLVIISRHSTEVIPARSKKSSTLNLVNTRGKNRKSVITTLNLVNTRGKNRKSVITGRGVLSGVLLDVSGSMKEKLNLDRTISGSHSVERTHAIITTLNGIVKKETVTYEDKRCDYIFVSAYGLKDVNTCDLIQLLDYQNRCTSDGSIYSITDYDLNPNLNCKLERVRQNDPLHTYMNGHEVLIMFAKEKNAPHAERWIKRALTKTQAGVLYIILSRDEKLTKEFIEKLPRSSATTALRVTSAMSFGVADVSDAHIHESEAYKLAMKVIYNFADLTTFLQSPEVQIPQIWTIKEVSDLLDKILQSDHTSNSNQECQQRELLWSIQNDKSTSSADESADESTKIKDLFDHLTPYIFGLTPMVESLNQAKKIFYQNNNSVDKKVLYILSDGYPSDGDPLPIAQELRNAGVTIITCFLTDNPNKIPKKLMDSKHFDCEANEGATKLFKMSSGMHNTEAPVSYFVDAGWELPTSGESKLYLQANTLDLVDEFCKIVFSHMENKTCPDALVDILAHISVADYINVLNCEFEPKRQRGKLCYANAIAAVYHLAMSRIIDRKGGVPKFEDILQSVTFFDRSNSGNTKFVIERTCFQYRLRFNEVDEMHAKKAVNERRPVIARFKFNNQQYGEFGKFFKENPKGILKSQDLTGLCNNDIPM